jgi:hypothetical protein
MKENDPALLTRHIAEETEKNTINIDQDCLLAEI